MIADDIIISKRSFFISTPNRYASGSPNCNKSSFLEILNVQIIVERIITIAGIIKFHVTPPKLLVMLDQFNTPIPAWLVFLNQVLSIIYDNILMILILGGSCFVIGFSFIKQFIFYLI